MVVPPNDAPPNAGAPSAPRLGAAMAATAAVPVDGPKTEEEGVLLSPPNENAAAAPAAPVAAPVAERSEGISAS